MKFWKRNFYLHLLLLCEKNVYLSDGTYGSLNIYSDYTKYLSNLRPIEACLVCQTNHYEWGDGSTYTLYVICYIDGANITYVQTDGTRQEDMTLNDMVCVINLNQGSLKRDESSGKLKLEYKPETQSMNPVHIKYFCEDLDYAHEYFTLSAYTSTSYTTDISYETYDISSFNIVLPEVN